MFDEKLFTALLTQFDACAQQFCTKSGGQSCRIDAQYKGKKSIENLSRRYAEVRYNNIAVIFKYTAHGVTGNVNSILECAICLKDDDLRALPLSFVIDYLDVDTLAPLTLPLITSPEGMEQAFLSLTRVLSGILCRLEDIGGNTEQSLAMLGAFTGEVGALLKTDTLTGQAYAAYYSWLTNHAVWLAYFDIICARPQKALTKLSKLKSPSRYEQRLMRLLSENYPAPEIPPEIRANAALYNENGLPKDDFAEFGALMLSWFALTVPFTLAYLLLYFALFAIENAGTVALLGPLSNAPMCLVMGMLSALSASYFTHGFILRKLNKKAYKRRAGLNGISFSGKTDRFMRGFFAVILVLCIGAGFLSVNCNVRFDEDGFTDSTDFFSLSGTFYPYGEVERVVLKSTFVNEFDEEIDNPHYIIVLKNGNEISLLPVASTEECAAAINYLKSRNIPVEGEE